jgi:type IV conjugative transfer system protein TraE
MDKDVLQTNLKYLIKQRNILALLTGCLILSNLFLSILSFRSEKSIILVPSVVSTEMEISKSLVNGEYIMAIARDIMFAYLNITPENVDILNNIVLSYTPSHIYASFKNELEERRDEIKLKGISQSFQISDIIRLENVITITGELSIFVGGKIVETKRKAYKLAFDFQNTRIRLNDFEEINPSDV